MDQLQSCIKLVREIFRSAAVVSERRDGRQHVLIAALTSETRLHAPYRNQRPWRDAVALLDGCEECGLRLLERAAARNDGRGSTLGEKLIKRQTEASLTAVGGDRSRRIVRLHQGSGRRSANALRPRLLLNSLFQASKPAAELPHCA